MFHPVIALAALSALAISSLARALTLDFDTITSATSANMDTGSYGGFTWTNFTVCRNDFLSSQGLTSGLDRGGITSPRYGAVNSLEGYAIVQSTTPFAFYGGDFTSLLKNNATLTLEGYRPGDPVGTISTLGTPSLVGHATLYATTPTHVSTDFTDIVALKILAYHDGNTALAWPTQPAAGDFFVVDNLAVSVPEPASLGTLVLGSLLLLRRRR